MSIPANQTGCLLDQGCNWNSWNNPTRESCMGVNVTLLLGPNLCGSTNNNQGSPSYYDVMNPPLCFAQRLQGDCIGASYLWSNNFNQCLFLGGLTGDTCLNGSICANGRVLASQTPFPSNPSFHYSDQVCATSSCFSNQTDCKSSPNVALDHRSPTKPGL